MPGLARGKPAGMTCPHLTTELRCALFDRPERPACCRGLQASEEMCGSNREQALRYLVWLEEATRPGIHASRPDA